MDRKKHIIWRGQQIPNRDKGVNCSYQSKKVQKKTKKKKKTGRLSEADSTENGTLIVTKSDKQIYLQTVSLGRRQECKIT